MDHIAEIKEELARPAQGAAHTDLAIRHVHGVSELFAHRDDLRGVHAFADVVEESARWSA